jgi:uncharacterized membrane protein YhaH (DUF805 family)
MAKYFKIKGRINRMEFLVLSLILFFIEVIILFTFEHDSAAFIITFSIVFFIYLIQCAKRYHDINKWGINGFVWFIIPIVNIIYFFELHLKKRV